MKVNVRIAEPKYMVDWQNMATLDPVFDTLDDARAFLAEYNAKYPDVYRIWSGYPGQGGAWIGVQILEVYENGNRTDNEWFMI